MRRRRWSFRSISASATCVALHVGVLVVIEPGALQLPIVHREAERLDEMQPRARIGGEADDVAGVRWNLRMDEDDLKHAAHLT